MSFGLWAKMPNPIDLAQGSQLNARSPSALGIGAASFASEVITEQAKIERKARRRSWNAQRKSQRTTVNRQQTLDLLV